MTGMFSASEIVELGIQIEINGMNFYNVISKKTKVGKVREIFLFLSKEEEKHIKTFQNILKSVQKCEPEEAYPQEYFSYINSLVEGCIFANPGKAEEIARGISNEKEAVNFGIKSEKDSIKFYEEMKKVIPRTEVNLVDKF